MKALKELKIPAVPSSASSQGSQTAGAGAQMPQMNPAAMNGIPTVTLSEIADIKEVGKAESISRTNGKEAIGIQIVKAADANTVDVVNAVKDKVKELEKKYKDLEIISTFDQGAPIEKSVETMLSKAILVLFCDCYYYAVSTKYPNNINLCRFHTTFFINCCISHKANGYYT